MIYLGIFTIDIYRYIYIYINVTFQVPGPLPSGLHMELECLHPSGGAG